MLIGDFHIHSKYARGCSKDLDIEHLEQYARIKGLNVLGTGDFTHPLWFKELQQKLNPDSNLLLFFKTKFPFILQTELSLIFSQGSRVRKVHNVILAKDFAVAAQIVEALKKKGRVDYDGRPIFGMSCIEFVEMMMQIDKDIEIIPAHIWTPWFSLFGANSGFDSIKECFGDQLKYLHALETGLSSDPAMNRRLSQLDDFQLISSSDSHSFWPWRLGREATLFDTELTYNGIITALRTRKGLKGTVEVSPLFGKYHLTGHRNCNVCLEPKQAAKLKSICPVCRRKLTVGVEQRVEELADRSEGYHSKNDLPFYTLIPLAELIAKVFRVGVATKTMFKEYNKLMQAFGTEFAVLLDAPEAALRNVIEDKLVDVILANRMGKISVKGGYDGGYGVPII